MGVAFGLAAALFWGLGDYLVTILTRSVGTTKALVGIQVLSLLFWIVFGAFQSRLPGADAMVWVYAVIAGVCHVLGLVLTYRAFEIGTLSIVSPLASGFAIVTALLMYMSNERPGSAATAGTLLLVVGVMLVTRSVSGEAKPSFLGVPEAIGSAFAFGIMFWLFAVYVEPALGTAVPLMLLKFMASVYAVLALAAARGKALPIEPESKPKFFLIALASALADAAAWICFIYGTATGYTAVVTALASLFSAVTVLLAWFFLKERLARHQWAGVAVVLVGVLLVSLP